HIMNWAKALFHSENTDLAIIPGSLTSMCQPLDVCINKPFKDKLCKYWHKWMSNGSNGITKKGNLKCADLNTKYGISNCLLGSEDHLIYDYDSYKDSEKEDSDEYKDEDSNEYKYEKSGEDNYEESNKNDEGEDSDKDVDEKHEYSEWSEYFVIID
ncbi:25405_t:CDS:2, partial [Gigaspora margarita]